METGGGSSGSEIGVNEGDKASRQAGRLLFEFSCRVWRTGRVALVVFGGDSAKLYILYVECHALPFILSIKLTSVFY